MNNKEKLNIEIDSKRLEDIAEKIGAIFRDVGKLIGKIIDILQKV